MQVAVGGNDELKTVLKLEMLLYESLQLTIPNDLLFMHVVYVLMRLSFFIRPFG